MIPSIGIAAEKTDPILRDKGQEIREGALASTNGDTTKAFIVVSDKTAQVVDSHNLIEAENKILGGIVKRMRDAYGFDDKTWVEKIYDSNIMKVILFLLGFKLGVEVAD